MGFGFFVRGEMLSWALLLNKYVLTKEFNHRSYFLLFSY